MIESTKLLKEAQAKEDSAEAKASLPTLAVSDLEREIKSIPIAVDSVQGVDVITHDLPSSGESRQSLFLLSSVVRCGGWCGVLWWWHAGAGRPDKTRLLGLLVTCVGTQIFFVGYLVIVIDSAVLQSNFVVLVLTRTLCWGYYVLRLPFPFGNLFRYFRRLFGRPCLVLSSPLRPHFILIK